MSIEPPPFRPQHDPVEAFKQFSTGAQREEKRVAYHLVPLEGLRRVAKTSHEGLVKYGEGNWEKGLTVANMLNHAVSHIVEYLLGDTSEDHLGHAAWNLMAACTSEERWPELNKGLTELLKLRKPS